MPKTQAKPAVSTINQNNIKIFGDNILYNNGIITAFYILPLTNYSTASYSGVESTIQEITNLIVNLTTNNPTVTFTIERIEKTVRAEDVRKNLIDTIKLYREDYEMPIEFTTNLQDDKQSFCLIGVDIQQSNIVDVDDNSLVDTAKSVFKSLVNSFAGLGNMQADPEQILRLENNIYRILNSKCARATKELVFYNFVSKIYPCYEISYDKLSYINENNFESIMGNVSQTVSDAFGSFTMENDGVDIFDMQPQKTYGVMIDIKAFPLMIDSVSFPMDFGPDVSVVTTIQCLKKEDASLKLKRTRSADKYELEQAMESGAELEQMEQTYQNINIATQAIQELDNGQVMCNFNVSILVTSAKSLEDAKSNASAVITACKDRNILAAKSLTQALDFLDNYINKKPKKFIHMSNIMYPLSFQQNAGATVGDIDTYDPKGNPVWSPAIGEDLV